MTEEVAYVADSLIGQHLAYPFVGVPSGAPQWSVLEMLLLMLFIDDIPVLLQMGVADDIMF